MPHWLINQIESRKKRINIFFDVIQTNIHFLFALFVLEQAQLGFQEVLFEIVIKDSIES